MTRQDTGNPQLDQWEVGDCLFLSTPVGPPKFSTLISLQPVCALPSRPPANYLLNPPRLALASGAVSGVASTVVSTLL